ncbi:ATP-binding protein [Pseudomonas protegens]|uniref:ATP-binding protein n=1 Tax=Pseudomonas protegens TaxID=380021 RepID=UPI0034D731CF
MIKRTLIAEKPFEFSARVTLQLGRESISSSTVAISELIKNSYDADAEKTSVSFHLKNHATSTLIIQDDGNGMSPEILFSHWLKIGTDNKSTNERSEIKRRVLTGAKGLGRLGIDRLCKKLVLYTKTKEMDKAIQLNIEWRRFENTSKSLSEIKHQIFEVDLPVIDKYGTVFSNTESSGTRMALIGLKDQWDALFLDTLENELRLLTSPFYSENDFSINLATHKDGIKTEKNLSSEELLNVARWKVKASVTENGVISVSYNNKQKGIEIIPPPALWNTWIKGQGDRPLFGPATFEFYYLVQDTENLSKLNLKVKNFREYMRLNQGVRLYRDNFRVRPYGEPSGKGDWLDLGLRKASSPGGVSQPGWRIGPNQIIGAALISREHNAILNDQANREGLVENSAFYQLRHFLLRTIETFEILVQKDASSDTEINFSEELAKILSKTNEDLEQAIAELKKTVSTLRTKKKVKRKQLSHEQIVSQRLTQLESLRKRQREAEKRYLEALKNEKSELEDQKNTLSNLASIGILTISFGHEVRQHSALALNGTTRALNSLQKHENPDQTLTTPIEFIKLAKDGAQYVDNFSRFAIDNIKPDKRTRKKVNVARVFNYVFDVFSATLKKMNIQTTINVPSENFTGEVYAFEIDWESIAINFMTNSIWAIESSPSRTNSFIIVDISESDEELSLIYKDSGIGLEIGAEETIFIPMNSGKRDIRGNVIGTGMGLAIVRTHVEDHMGGQITANAQSDIGGAEFTIKVPTRGRAQ